MLRKDLSDDEQVLVSMAESSIEQAVAPLTRIKIGSTILTDKDMYVGCNVESYISGLGICAERNALNHAVIHEGGRLKIMKIAVASLGKRLIRPCGACLQYISEFSSTDVKIIMVNSETVEVEANWLSVMIPYVYIPPINPNA
jgi:cytidine deaminase